MNVIEFGHRFLEFVIAIAGVIIFAILGYVFVKGIEVNEIQLMALTGMGSMLLVFLIWLQFRNQSEQVNLMKRSMEPKLDIHYSGPIVDIIFSKDQVEEKINLDTITKEKSEQILSQSIEDWYTYEISSHIKATNTSPTIVTIKGGKIIGLEKYLKSIFNWSKTKMFKCTFDTGGSSTTIESGKDANFTITFKYEYCIPAIKVKKVDVMLMFADKTVTTGIQPADFYVKTITDNGSRFHLRLDDFKQKLKNKYNLK